MRVSVWPEGRWRLGSCLHHGRPWTNGRCSPLTPLCIVRCGIGQRNAFERVDALKPRQRILRDGL